MIKKINVYVILEAINSSELFKTYFAEGTTSLLQEGIVNKEIYYKMSNMGKLDCYGVFNGTTLVGFIIASTSESPHYSKLVTTVMSFFVSKEFRRNGTAKQLIELVELDAKRRGSAAILIASPFNGILGKFITKLGYKANTILYGKAINGNS